MDNLSGAEPGSFSKLVDVPREGPLSHVENLCRGVAGLPPHADMSLAFLLPGAGAGSDNEVMAAPVLARSPAQAGTRHTRALAATVHSLSHTTARTVARPPRARS